MTGLNEIRIMVPEKETVGVLPDAENIVLEFLIQVPVL